MKIQSTKTLSQEFCGECGWSLIQAGNEVVCGKCGLVDKEQTSSFIIEKAISSKPSVDNSSLGERYHLLDGTGSFIDYSNALYFYDGNGKPLSPKSQKLFLRLKTTYDKQVRFYGRGVDYRTLCSLNRVVETLRMPNVVRDRASYLYRKVMRKVRARIPSTLVAAYCLLHATRELCSSTPVTIQEVAEAFRVAGHRVSAPAIVKAGFYFREIFGAPLRVRRSEEFLERVIERTMSNKEVVASMNRVGVDPSQFKGKLLKISLMLLNNIARDRCGRNPYVLAVSSVYAAEKLLAREESRKPVFTQRGLAKVVSVAEYSIREHFCKIFKNLIRNYSPTIL